MNTLRALPFLLAAAILEVGGDALIRAGMKGGGIFLLVAGTLVLVAYGFLVNLTRLDFGRLMGIYIVLFFLMAQVAGAVFFGERPSLAILIGGSFVLAGGIIMTLSWA